MKKVIFTLRPHSVVDVITNSSSELFVGKSQSLSTMKELIEAVYPDYLTEYNELKSIDDLTADELEIYFSYTCSPHCWPGEKSQWPVIPEFTFEELYVEEDGGKPAWNGEIQYRLKNNVINAKNKWDQSFVTEENFEEIKNKLDPNREMYFLFSLDDNPNWDMQEQLESFMDHHHLG
jgi:hypothetical protein